MPPYSRYSMEVVFLCLVNERMLGVRQYILIEIQSFREIREYKMTLILNSSFHTAMVQVVVGVLP